MTQVSENEMFGFPYYFFFLQKENMAFYQKQLMLRVVKGGCHAQKMLSGISGKVLQGLTKMRELPVKPLRGDMVKCIYFILCPPMPQVETT